MCMGNLSVSGRVGGESVQNTDKLKKQKRKGRKVSYDSSHALIIFIAASVFPIGQVFLKESYAPTGGARCLLT